MQLSPEEFNEFKVEAMELLEAAEKALLNFEDSAQFTDNKNIIFRSFHSLKGSAGMLELLDLQSHMHNLENKLTQIDTVEKVNQADIDYFLKGVDTAKSILNGDTPAVPEAHSEPSDSTVLSITSESTPQEVQVHTQTTVIDTHVSSTPISSSHIELLEKACQLLNVYRSEGIIPIQSPIVKEKVDMLISDLTLEIEKLKKI